MAMSGPDHAATTTPLASRRPCVSVVIPTYRRPEMLDRCIQALLHQQDVPGDIEIVVVVVDDARTPVSKGMICDYLVASGLLRVRYLHPPTGTRGPAAARNAGWRVARGTVIAFTDDDTIPDPRWLAEGLCAMRSGIAAAWGRVVVPMPPAPTDAERNIGGLHEAEFVTANCFVRRDALLRVGGFDERFERAWREDSDLYFSLLGAGLEVRPVAAAVVIHPVRDAPAATSIHRHRNLLFDALLYKKHPRLYRAKIAAGPPRLYYAIVLCMLGLLAGFVAGLPALSLAGALGWFALSGCLAVRRLRGVSRHWLNVTDIVLSSILIPFVAVYWRLAGAWRYRVLFV